MGTRTGARQGTGTVGTGAVGALALAAGLAVVAGCSSASEEPVDRRSVTTASPTPSSSGDSSGNSSGGNPTESPSSGRSGPARYRPDAAEVDGAAKRVAARAVEDLPDVRRVSFTQYFGYLPPTASILVEADFAGGGGTTYDVRISQDGGRWRADSVTEATKAPRLRDPGPLAREVLDSDRIQLNWAGRVDVAAGLMAQSALRSMLAVAQEHRIEVSVLVSAHPLQVFGTDRRSNHPDGLAYDIGRIDGRLVVDPRSAALVRRVMERAATTGAYQVGGPVDLDGAGSQYFADLTHSDHVHVGFTA